MVDDVTQYLVLFHGSRASPQEVDELIYEREMGNHHTVLRGFERPKISQPLLGTLDAGLEGKEAMWEDDGLKSDESSLEETGVLMCELEETDNPRRGIKGHVCKISTIKDSRNSGGREESEMREPGFVKLPKRRNKR